VDGIIPKDLKIFPKSVQRDIEQALMRRGTEYPSVKALKGFGGRAVLEIVASGEAGTCWTVYTDRATACRRRAGL
jgi:hypothetical protein